MAFDNRPLPEVFLIGDSISMYYGPYLQKYLAGSYTLLRKEDNGHAADNLDIPTGANGGDSHMVLQYLQIKQRDPAFRQALLRESVECILNGDIDTGKAVLRDYVNATVGFQTLEKSTRIPAKSLMRMLSPNGSPSVANFSNILTALQKTEGVHFELSLRR